MIKSRPLYQPLKIDPAGRAHLIVSDLAKLPDTPNQSTPPLANIETWLVNIAAPGIEAPASGATKSFRAVADLLLNLAYRLQRETIGLRLYAIGTEAFLWDAHNTARQAGLGTGEIFLTHAGSLRRRVYCTHCKTINDNVTTSITQCRACQANLFVRDHFSRRLAAFMGVAADAEAPGEIPAPELLYP
jgi:hypothetical protein